MPSTNRLSKAQKRVIKLMLEGWRLRECVTGDRATWYLQKGAAGMGGNSVRVHKSTFNFFLTRLALRSVATEGIFYEWRLATDYAKNLPKE